MFQVNTVKKQFAATRKVPITDNGFPELPARYPTLDVAFDVLETMPQLTLQNCHLLAAANPHC